MKRRLVLAHEAVALIAKMRLEVPVKVFHPNKREGYLGLLFLNAIDFDEFVAELNDLCYRDDGGDA